MPVTTTERQPGSRRAAFSLSDRVAWVTGSTRGIGKAVAHALAEAGAHVIIHGRNEKVARSAADAFVANGLKASAVRADVTSEVEITTSLDQIISAHGKIDILVNNAGVVARSAVTETQTEDWRALMESNLTSCFVLAREVGKHMIENGHGRIINISSVAGLFAASGRVGYVASKHALIGLTRSLALELAGAGVTANAIAPGFIATEMNAGMQNDETLDRWVRERNPQRRWGSPEHVAHAALYLASDEASFVNGSVLCVDGGMSAVVM